jgi:Mrp family chromosome partitioning ATPase
MSVAVAESVTVAPAASGVGSLLNLDQAIRQEPATPAKKPTPPPREASVVDLLSVTQLEQDRCTPAFPIIDLNFPADWKEEVRQLRATLEALQIELEAQQHPMQVIMLTSTGRDTPRRDLAANLTLAMSSQRGVRALYIDADFTSPSLAGRLQLERGDGLAEVTRGEASLISGATHRLIGSQLYFLTCGIATGFFDPFDYRGLNDLLSRLRYQFDWIVINAPPCSSGADASQFGMAADGVLMAVEREKDSFDDLQRALQRMPSQRMLGTIMV